MYTAWDVTGFLETVVTWYKSFVCKRVKQWIKKASKSLKNDAIFGKPQHQPQQHWDEWMRVVVRTSATAAATTTTREWKIEILFFAQEL